MGGILGDTIKLVSLKLKRRDDGITDQYNRILMTKMCLMFSAIIGYNYFTDKVSCIVGNSESMKKEFVGSTCWIQGFYIYKDMRDRLDESAYFGIPRNMDYDGTNSAGVLCSTSDRAADKVETCNPMEKQIFLQYQYMPFLISSFAMLFYLPYLIFKITNTDLVSLKNSLKDGKATPDTIMSSYFNLVLNSRKRMRYRVAMMIGIRVLYLLANLFTLLALNVLINGDYIGYGKSFIDWGLLENDEAHDHSLKLRAKAKPGNMLLPAMGYCDVTEASRDTRNTRINYHKLLCEISPHVLYQYVLLVFWFLLLVGIILSVFGVVAAICGHMVNFIVFVNAKDQPGLLYKVLTIREIDYLEYIRRKDLILYEGVFEKLRAARLNSDMEEKPTMNNKNNDFYYN